jgi:Uma2 family endonuclease
VPSGDTTRHHDSLGAGSRGELTTDDLPNDIPGVRMELINGSLIVTPLADFEHQAILTRLCVQLEPHLP